jgi:hypothetical protein
MMSPRFADCYLIAATELWGNDTLVNGGRTEIEWRTEI